MGAKFSSSWGRGRRLVWQHYPINLNKVFKHLRKASLDRHQRLKLLCKNVCGRHLYQLNYPAVVVLAWRLQTSWLSVLHALSSLLILRTLLSPMPGQMKKSSSLNKWDRPEINYQTSPQTSHSGVPHRYRLESSLHKGCFMSVSFLPL